MNRKTGVILLCVHGVLILGLLAVNLALAVPEPPKAAGPSARLAAVVGQVELRRAGGQRWDLARVGDVLAEADEIRTGVFSEATLMLRGASLVVVSADSNFVVGQDRTERSQFELGAGIITADIPQASSREYAFHSRGSDAVAYTRQGEFSMASDGRGTVVVDNREGDLKLKAGGSEVQLNPGRRSTVRPHGPPSQAMPVPTTLALAVKWPPTKTDRKVTTVSGKTTVGAVLLINGIVVRTDMDGNFTLDVALKEGINRVVVSATDPSGNTATEVSPELMVDTRPPNLKVDAEGLWK